MNRFSWRLTLPLLAALLATAGAAEAKYDVNRPAPTKPTSQRPGAGLCATSSSRSELDINNVRAMVLNGGDMWWDLDNARYEVPKVTEENQPRRHSIFAGSLWIGGEDENGLVYVAAQTYRQGNPPDAGFWPGPLDDQGNIDADVCTPWNVHTKINREDIDKFRSTKPGNDPATLPTAIREWPARNNPYLTRPRLNQTLAPFVDVDGDGNYDPLRGDYPDIRGDQAIWWVINDAGGIKRPATSTIGLELDVMAFAFKTSDLINNMTFYQQKVINKGQKTLYRTYIGQWVDPDLGFYNDDYVGCDVGRGLGFCYNGDNFDEGVSGYGDNPPTVAVDFFEGPLADANDGIDNDRDSYTTGVFDATKVDEPREKIIMSNFVYYNNDFSINGNPTAAVHFYNYLRSKITNGTDLQFGGNGLSNTNGQPYAFMFPGGGCNPNSDPYGFGFANPPIAGRTPPYNWSESNTGNGRNVPSDRRFLQSAGPFTLRPGAVNQITIGVIWARAGSGGPQGSNGLVCFADDLAQSLFDNGFHLPPAPLAPTVTATELDRQAVISIEPRVERDTAGNVTASTEGFVVADTALPAGVRDNTFRFEGYLVYEVSDNTVTPQEFNDPDKAQLIARYDVVNDVSQIVNYEFDTDLNDVVPKVKVSGDNANQGIFHTINVKNTKFSLSSDPRLVNFKKYYFYVQPYAVNTDRTLAPNGKPFVISPFRPGEAVKVTVIPSKPVSLNGGTTLNSEVYSGIPVVRELGQGAGENVLEITDADKADIARDGSKQQLHYLSGKGPINVRVYDPLRVHDENFTVKFSSRLTYLESSAFGSARPLYPGDIIVSTGQYQTGHGRLAGSYTLIDPTYGPQIPGRAIVRRYVGKEDIVTPTGIDHLVTYDIEMLNDDKGGTFVANVQRVTTTRTGTMPGDTLATVQGYEQEPRSFRLEATQEFSAIAAEFAVSDFWHWKASKVNVWHDVERRVSEVNEELIPDYGLSIQVKPGRDPGYRVNNNVGAQLLEATLTQGRPAWLAGVPNEKGAINTTLYGISWLLPEAPANGSGELSTRAWDPGGKFSNLLPVVFPGLISFGGTWGAYVNAKQVNPSGAAYVQGPTRRLSNLHNVDIVLTANKDLWTRVPVLQINSGNPTYALTKKLSTKFSVGKEGQEDNSTLPSGQRSTGMGWFPGYALDIDRGIRLNMAFAESSAPLDAGGQGPDKGTNLIWEPGDSGPNGGANVGAAKYAGRNFIYITETRYDEGREMERRQDSIAQIIPASAARKPYQKLYDQFMYVGYPQIVAGQKALQSDARVRIRVNRAFVSYPETPSLNGPNTNPEYTFALQGQSVVTNQRQVACDALSLVRVVPNPYYAFSTYEEGQIATFSRITNLPRRAQVTIYTLNGTLVRRINKDDAATWTDFNMKNDNGLPIASGVYLFHVKDPATGCEEVVRWFCIMRPVDLDSFGN